MQPKATITASGAILIAALSLSACETTQIGEHLPPPPAADLGPEFELVKAPESAYEVSGAIDGAGRAHLIVAVKEPKQVSGAMDDAYRASKMPAMKNARQVRHLVIGPQGVVSSEIIRTGVKGRVVDLAFDRASTLHALIDGEHLMKSNGAWIGSLRTPWKEANVRFDKPAFVKGMPDLTWAFYVSGSEIGLRGRTDLKLGSGGANPVPIPYPSTVEVRKLMVVPEETLYRHWNAVGMEDRNDVWALHVAGDKHNVLHALYTLDLFEGLQFVKYAAFGVDSACPEPSPDFKLANGVSVCPVRGVSFVRRTHEDSEPAMVSRIQVDEQTAARIASDAIEMDVATDPDSGAVLMAGVSGVSILLGDKATHEQPIGMPIKNARLLLASGGKNRFHAFASGRTAFRIGDPTEPVYYLEFSDGAWSAPLKIGSRWANFDQRAFKISVSHGSAIVSDDKGHALLIWPKEDAAVARWVTLR